MLMVLSLVASVVGSLLRRCLHCGLCKGELESPDEAVAWNREHV